MNTSFGEALPEFGEKAVQLTETMTTISMILVFVGLTLKYIQGSYGNLSQIVQALVSAGVIAVIIPGMNYRCLDTSWLRRWMPIRQSPMNASLG